MDEDIKELGDRIDGLRLIVSVLISQLPNRDEVLAAVELAEAHARRGNLPAGVQREMADLREALDAE